MDIYNSIFYRSNCFYLCCYQDGVKVAQDKKPFCRCYAINTAETTKGQDVGEIKYIFFDEFITRQFYLANEFILFQNLLSSIVRHRAGIKIYMVAKLAASLERLGIVQFAIRIVSPAIAGIQPVHAYPVSYFSTPEEETLHP